MSSAALHPSSKADQVSAPVIDTHVHIWSHADAYPWPVETAYRPKYEARPDSLTKLMDENSVDAAVLVQYIGYRWDNSYVAEILKAGSSRFMAVCRVNPEDPKSPQHLQEWTTQYGFHGVRLSPESDARGDWFAGPLMEPLFRQAAELGVPVLILTKPARLTNLREILERVPDVDVVIDHCADCISGSVADFELLLTFADNPRVFLKTGHIWIHSTEPYPWRDTVVQLQRLSQVFGANRIMWGSDWPLSLRRMTYPQSLSFLRAADVLTEEELAWIHGKTALRIWSFGRPDGG